MINRVEYHYIPHTNLRLTHTLLRIYYTLLVILGSVASINTIRDSSISSIIYSQLGILYLGLY